MNTTKVNAEQITGYAFGDDGTITVALLIGGCPEERTIDVEAFMSFYSKQGLSRRWAMQEDGRRHVILADYLNESVEEEWSVDAVMQEVFPEYGAQERARSEQTNSAVSL
jgi:hypothetical protein